MANICTNAKPNQAKLSRCPKEGYVGEDGTQYPPLRCAGKPYLGQEGTIALNLREGSGYSGLCGLGKQYLLGLAEACQFSDYTSDAYRDGGKCKTESPSVVTVAVDVPGQKPFYMQYRNTVGDLVVPTTAMLKQDTPKVPNAMANFMNYVSTHTSFQKPDSDFHFVLSQRKGGSPSIEFHGGGSIDVVADFTKPKDLSDIERYVLVLYGRLQGAGADQINDYTFSLRSDENGVRNLPNQSE